MVTSQRGRFEAFAEKHYYRRSSQRISHVHKRQSVTYDRHLSSVLVVRIHVTPIAAAAVCSCTTDAYSVGVARAGGATCRP